MTVASEITRITGNIADTYTAASDKGATIPATQNSDNLATCIASIPSGGGDTTHAERAFKANYWVDTSGNVHNFTFVSGNTISAEEDTLIHDDTNCLYFMDDSNNPIKYADLSAIEELQDENAVTYPGLQFGWCSELEAVDLSSLEEINVTNNNYSLIYIIGNPKLSKIDLSSLTTVSGYKALGHLGSGGNFTTVELPALETITGDNTFDNAFESNNSPITKVDLHSLKTITGNFIFSAFLYYNTATTLELDLSSLETVSGNTVFNNYSGFLGSSSLLTTNIKLGKLETVSGTNTFNSVFNKYSGPKIDLSSVKTLSLGGGSGTYGPFASCCVGNTNITEVDISGITTGCAGAFNMAFKNSSNLATVSFPQSNNVINYESMFNTAFQGTKIATLNLSFVTSLTNQYVFAYAFQSDTSLTTVNLSNLTTVSGSGVFQSTFLGCTNLTQMTFTNLSTLTGATCFKTCFRNSGLTSLSFPALTSSSFGSKTNQFNNMLQGVTGCTVHFPSNLQSVIGSWSDVSAGFGGTNTTVLFDLTATS